MVPKPYLGAELTGPNLFRFVDREKPTLFNDEADGVFTRRPDLAKIYNAAWTRGTKISAAGERRDSVVRSVRPEGHRSHWNPARW